MQGSWNSFTVQGISSVFWDAMPRGVFLGCLTQKGLCTEKRY